MWGVRKVKNKFVVNFRGSRNHPYGVTLKDKVLSLDLFSLFNGTLRFVMKWQSKISLAEYDIHTFRLLRIRSEKKDYRQTHIMDYMLFVNLNRNVFINIAYN